MDGLGCIRSKPVRLLNLIKEYYADLQPALPYTGRWLLEFIAELGVVVVHPIKLMLQGQFNGSIAEVVRQALLTLVRYPVQLVLTLSALFFNALASLINNAFLTTQERALNQQEQHYLQPIFGHNFDYAAVRIQTGGMKEKLKISPQAVGADIFLRQFWGDDIFHDDRSLTPAGLRLLGHEVCHVWQFQQNGASYIGDSLMTQLLDRLGRKLGMHWSDGYDLLAAIRNRRPYDQYNVEQQAVLAELIGAACCGNEPRELTRAGFNRVSRFDLDDVEFVYVQDGHEWLTGTHRHA